MKPGENLQDDVQNAIPTRLAGKSYKLAEYARNRLAEFAPCIGTASTLVAVNESGRFVPVVIYRDGTGVNVGALIHSGITVLN